LIPVTPNFVTLVCNEPTSRRFDKRFNMGDSLLGLLHVNRPGERGDSDVLPVSGVGLVGPNAHSR
jgi:hypothetical protein